MPVTELAFFSIPTTADGAITPALEAAFAEALRVQDAWCAANLPSGSSSPASASPAEARGAALFQQHEDPTTALLTAHWPSVAEHGRWIASPENARVFGALQALVDTTRIRFFHVDGVEAFPVAIASEGEGEGRTPALRSPGVGLTRCRVVRDRRDEFDRVYADVGASRRTLGARMSRSTSWSAGAIAWTLPRSSRSTPTTPPMRTPCRPSC